MPSRPRAPTLEEEGCRWVVGGGRGCRHVVGGRCGCSRGRGGGAPMSVTSPVIPLLGLLTLVVPLMGVLMALTPYLMPKRECFAVTVPDDAARDPYLRRLKRAYLAIMLALAAAATIACAAALALDPEHAFVATLVVAALVLCVGGYALMLYFRAKVQRYKKAQGWVAEGRRSAGFIGDEPFPKPLSLAWDLLYVPVILITLAMGIVGYPAMPGKVPLHMDLAGKVTEWADKSPGIVAFPVLFVVFIAVCLTVAHWVILRSKKGSDPAMPAAAPGPTACSPALRACCSSAWACS